MHRLLAGPEAFLRWNARKATLLAARESTFWKKISQLVERVNKSRKAPEAVRRG